MFIFFFFSIKFYRSAFDDAAQDYLAEHYINGGCTVYGAKKGGQTNITVCISSSKFNPNNFWNGRWRSVWECTFSGNGSITLKGNLKLQVHYYEDGNVQLNSNTNKSGNANGGVSIRKITKIIENIIIVIINIFFLFFF